MSAADADGYARHELITKSNISHAAKSWSCNWVCGYYVIATSLSLSFIVSKESSANQVGRWKTCFIRIAFDAGGANSHQNTCQPRVGSGHCAEGSGHCAVGSGHCAVGSGHCAEGAAKCQVFKLFMDQIKKRLGNFRILDKSMCDS